MYSIEEMKEMKQEYGLSYEDITKHADGVSISSVQKIIGGVNTNPRRVTLEKISAAYETLLLELHTNKEKRRYIMEKMKNSENIYKHGDIKDEGIVLEEQHFSTKGSSAVNLNNGGTGGNIFTQSGYTYEDYEKLELPDGVYVEVIDGEIITMDSPGKAHQDIVAYIFNSFFNYIKKNKGKCRVYTDPFDVRLEYGKKDMTVLKPDVLVICDRDKLNNKAIFGAPDFVMEVISPSSRKRDMYIKMTKYKENGVREYWIVDYDRDKIIKYNFEKDDMVNMYTFEDMIPVDIYDGKLVIDFKEVKEYIEG